jgi:hypothetical protein
MDISGGIVLSTDQLLTAPPAVQRWLRSSVLGLEPSEDDLVSDDGFVLTQNGIVSSDDGLAVCTVHEIKMLLRGISENYAALQVFFQLGCDYRNPATGERRPYPLRLSDFRRHTDVGNIPRLRNIIHDVNERLKNMRGDPEAVLCRISSHDVYHVHEVTQYRIYRYWRPLSKVEAKHVHGPPILPSGELALEEHLMGSAEHR